MSLGDYKALQTALQKSQDVAKKINKLQVVLLAHVPGVYDRAMEDAAKAMLPLYEEALKLSVEEDRMASKCGRHIDKELGHTTSVAAPLEPPDGYGGGAPVDPLAYMPPAARAAARGKKRNAGRAELDEEDYDPMFDDGENADDFIIPEAAHSSKFASRGSARKARNTKQRSSYEDDDEYVGKVTPRAHSIRNSSGGGHAQQYPGLPTHPGYGAPPAAHAAYGAPPPAYHQHPNATVVKTGNDMVVPRGQQVAAKIRDPTSLQESWILATILEYISATKKYRIKDEDTSDPTFTPEYLVPGASVVWLSEASTILTAKGGDVLAMYPESTSFYKATVVQSASSRGERYMLFFDDDASGQVKQVDGCYVFPFLP